MDAEVPHHVGSHPIPRCRSAVKTMDPIENDTLLHLTQHAGSDVDWKAIAINLPGHSAVQCPEHWTEVLDPSINRAHWTSDELGQLAKLHDQNRISWAAISKQMPGRTVKQCRNKWILQIRSRESWTAGEAKTLVELVHEVGSTMDLGPFASFKSDCSEVDRCERWIFVLDPFNENISWASDAYLRIERNSHLAWIWITDGVPSRTLIEYRYRALILLGFPAYNDTSKRAGTN